MKTKQISFSPRDAANKKNSGTLDDYKKCPYCGQCSIPFKHGICVCGKAITEIYTVKDPEQFIKSNYSDFETTLTVVTQKGGQINYE